MPHEEKTFNFRFSLDAHFPEDYASDEDGGVWLREWERDIKPKLVKAVFSCLREHPDWRAHVRNRGMSQEDEIEIAVERDF